MIVNDEQYQATLARIVKASEFIENPLTDDKDRKTYMIRYDQLCDDIDKYKVQVYASEFPYLKQVYENIGLLERERTVPTALLPVPDPPKPAINLSDFLE